MFNILLDHLPTEYEGYLIRTDYRIGIQISQALEDKELEIYEQIGTALELLYGNGVPEDRALAIEGLKWFMRAGADPAKDDDDNGIDYFSFDHDSARIYSGFRRVYGIEIDHVEMHWFRFLAMIADLGECAFTQVVGYRMADTTGMPPQTKAAYNQMKRQFALPQPENEDSKEFFDKLLS